MSVPALKRDAEQPSDLAAAASTLGNADRPAVATGTSSIPTAESRASCIDDALINTQLQEHASHVEWSHAEILAELGTWYVRFNDEFFASALPPAAVSVERSRVNNLGWYMPMRDGLGLRFRVNVNSLHLERARALVLGVLLHETLHVWEDAICRRDARGGNYHTVRFRKRAAELGIPTDENGIWGGIADDGPFAALLRRHGVSLEVDVFAGGTAKGAVPLVVAKGPGSRLARWNCGCTKVWASGGVTVRAVCERCGGAFVQQPKGDAR